MNWEYDDGGRAAAGYRGDAGDCVTRAIAISSGLPYQDVYDEVFRRIRAAKRKKAGASPRNGVSTKLLREYLADLGYKWTPTMGIGTGTRVHLREDELPDNCIANVSKHICAVVDGVIHDTHDPSRDGTRAVYGYWTREGG